MTLVYKDGITKTVDDKDLSKHLEMGFEIVKPKDVQDVIDEKPKKVKKGE